jgi:hypothetical protein
MTRAYYRRNTLIRRHAYQLILPTITTHIEDFNLCTSFFVYEIASASLLKA